MEFRLLRFRRKKQTEAAVSKSRRTWFGKVATLFQRSRLDDDLWDELEELLISADVGVGTTQTLLQRLKERVREDRVTEPQEALRLLKEEMVAILEARGNANEATSALDATDEIPLVLLVVGVNGVGKTTTIAKLTRRYTEEGKTVLLGAADTFRAAAVEQLQSWGGHLGVDVIAHRHGADPGAVAFDTVQAAKSRKLDVAIIDTAGRLHTKSNLMEELKKVQRVLANQGAAAPRVLLVLDATIGQNGLAQARAFTEAFQCHGVFLAKLDGTSKGGVVLAIVQELELPVLFIGSGEQPEDIGVFDAGEFVEGLFTSLDAN
jgi:fused signal recognition particle receptor